MIIGLFGECMLEHNLLPQWRAKTERAPFWWRYPQYCTLSGAMFAAAGECWQALAARRVISLRLVRIRPVSNCCKPGRRKVSISARCSNWRIKPSVVIRSAWTHRVNAVLVINARIVRRGLISRATDGIAAATAAAATRLVLSQWHQSGDFNRGRSAIAVG